MYILRKIPLYRKTFFNNARLLLKKSHLSATVEATHIWWWSKCVISSRCRFTLVSQLFPQWQHLRSSNLYSSLVGPNTSASAWITRPAQTGALGHPDPRSKHWRQPTPNIHCLFPSRYTAHQSEREWYSKAPHTKEEEASRSSPPPTTSVHTT